MNPNTRIPVLALDNTPLMPTLYPLAQQWVDSGIAEWVSNDLNIKQVRLLREPSSRNTQPIVVGVDPGKKFSGIAVQSSLFTASKNLRISRHKSVNIGKSNSTV